MNQLTSMKKFFIALVTLLIVLFAGSGELFAEDTPQEAKNNPFLLKSFMFPLQSRVYGEFQLNYYDYPPLIYRNRATSTPRDSRLTADISRFSWHGTQIFVPTAGVEFEVNVAHFGASGQNSPNYNGPFSDTKYDSASDGGVQLSQVFLFKEWGGHAILYGGRIPVAVGLLALTESPIDYIAPNPFEAETNFLPSNWTEMGLAAKVSYFPFSSLTQLVNGLDSAGFDSYRFVANGEQGRYGSVRVTEPAIVERIELSPSRTSRFGTSVYYGETSQNRPTSDMKRFCENRNASQAPCGYINAPLTIIDLHAVVALERFRANALALWGRLRNASTINRLNNANRTNLPDFYTPVGSEAYGVALEVGYEFFPADHIELFGKVERYDTMLKNADPEDSNPATDRKLVSLGAVFRPTSYVYAKGSWSERNFGTTRFASESTATGAIGFRF